MAAPILEEGLALAREIPCPHAEARLLHLDGLLHAQQGEPEAAIVLSSSKGIKPTCSAMSATMTASMSGNRRLKSSIVLAIDVHRKPFRTTTSSSRTPARLTAMPVRAEMPPL